MNRCIFFICAISLFMAPVLQAQVAGTFGPKIAPVGCNIKMSITNDTGATIGTGPCYYTVHDATGNAVYAPFICPFIWIPIGPGQTLTKEWPQVTNNGNHVPPGQYIVTLTLPSGAGQVTGPLSIVPQTPTSAGITPASVFRSGMTRHLDLWAPAGANHPYLVLASATATTGVPTCAGIFPLDYDFLFAMSLSYNTGVFQNTYNLMSGFGTSLLPAIAIPANVSGISFNVAFVTIDPTQGCGISTMSAAEQIMIQ